MKPLLIGYISYAQPKSGDASINDTIFKIHQAVTSEHGTLKRQYAQPKDYAICHPELQCRPIGNLLIGQH
jgi:hypothetical protein